MEADNQDRVRDGEERLLRPTAFGQPSVLSAEIGIRPRGGMGGFQQELAQPRTALACRAMELLARALVVARTHPRPRREVLATREPTHIGPNLGEDAFCCSLANAGYRIEKCHGLGLRLGLQMPLDFPVDPRTRLVQHVAVP